MLTDPPQASRREAVETLGDVARLRRRTRRSLGAPWFPLTFFGAVTMLSAPLVAAAGTSILAPWWLVGGTAGMLLTHRHYRQRARRRGVTGRGRRSWSIAVAMFTGCLVAGAAAGVTSGESAGVLAPIVVVLAGYVAMGWLQRSLVPWVAVAPVAGLAMALILIGLAPWAVELTFGAGLVAVGTALRVLETRS